jgi:hypothetical protein
VREDEDEGRRYSPLCGHASFLSIIGIILSTELQSQQSEISVHIEVVLH